MASPLTKTIMNNISKKKLNKECYSNKVDEYKSVDNINENEEELLKSILYKNKTKINLNTLKNNNLNNKKEIDKNLINHKQIEKLCLEKQTNALKSIKDLANKKDTAKETNIQNSDISIDRKAKIETRSLKSLSKKSSNMKEISPKDKKTSKKLSLKDLAK